MADHSAASIAVEGAAASLVEAGRAFIEIYEHCVARRRLLIVRTWMKGSDVEPAIDRRQRALLAPTSAARDCQFGDSIASLGNIPPKFVPNDRLPTEHVSIREVIECMKRVRSRYEVFPAQAVLAGGRFRIAWAWQRIAQSGTIRHAALYDTLEDCLTSINRHARHRALPTIRVVLSPVEASSANG